MKSFVFCFIFEEDLRPNNNDEDIMFQILDFMFCAHETMIFRKV